MQNNVQEYINFFDKIISNHIDKGVSEFYFNSGENLKIKVNQNIVENPQLNIDKNLVEVVVKKLISENQNRSFDSIETKDLAEISNGIFEYNINQDTTYGLKTRILKSTPQILENGTINIKMVLEPEIKIGYSENLKVGLIDNDDKFEMWFEDFAMRTMAMTDPKPKDIIFHPNKVHPFLTVTGGLRPITDIVITPGVTNRIAKMLVKLSHNPSIDAVFEKNNSSFDTLDIDLAYKTKSGRRFRVNIADVFDAETEHGCLITMRLLPKKPFTVEELGLPNVLTETIFNLKMGLILISGTTGSGKSTTMGALIDFLLKSKSVNLLTIESPIETIFPSENYPKSVITQREVGKHSISQSKSMESAVRQTLNMAMVGEIRNAHDAMMAIELAQSGHLIFATLHAGSTGESIDRIVEMFPSDQSRKVRDLLASQYKMGVAQTLVKGIHGQTELALEIFKTNIDIKAFITQTQEKDRQFSMREIIEMSRASGSMSFDQCLVNLFNQSKINEDIMMFNSPDTEALIFRQGKLGVKLSSKWDPVGNSLDMAMDNIIVKRQQEKLEREQEEKARLEAEEAAAAAPSLEDAFSQLNSLNSMNQLNSYTKRV